MITALPIWGGLGGALGVDWNAFGVHGSALE